MATTRLFAPRPYDSIDFGVATVAPILSTGTDVDNTKVAAVQAAAVAGGYGTLATSAGGAAPAPFAAPLRDRGPWQANTVYSYGDVVTQAGSVYVAPSSFTSGSSFVAGNWTKLGLYDATDPSLATTYVAPSAIAPAATGVAATDTANLQAAINATPAGGRLYLPKGVYALNASLTVTNHITIEGEGVSSTFSSRTAGGDPYDTTGTKLAGTILDVTVAATNAIAITGSALSVNLARIGVLFQAGLASTGHAFYAAPTQTFGTGHDNGLLDFVWEDLWCYGHDGDHYAIYLLNAMQGTIIHPRGIGGGGMFVASDGNTDAFGNLAVLHPMFILSKAGTAGGYVHSSATTNGPGCLNLMVYLRPQCNMWGAAQTAGTQPLWNDNAGAGYPVNVSVYDADLESNNGSTPVTFGLGTKIWGNGNIHGFNAQMTTYGVGALPYGLGVQGTAFGNLALGANTSGARNVAVGGSALAGNTSGSNNTAVGNLALAASTTSSDNAAFGKSALGAQTTGSGNTAVGSNALSTLTTATSNTAVGLNALKVATGNNGTAVGSGALAANTTGTPNTAVGMNALTTNTTGGNNTAVGQNALNSNVTNSNLTAVGTGALWHNTADDNTAVGYNALTTNTTGTRNTAVGKTAASAASTATDLTAVGWNALNAATNGANAAVGSYALMSLTTGSGSTAVGHQAGYTLTAGNASTTAINQTFVGAFSGQPSATQAPYATALGYAALAGGTTTGYATALGAKTSASAAGSVAIGVDNAGTGAASATTNLIVLGTALHTTQIPGLPAFVASDKYLVVDASGNIHKSALGPAS